MLKSFTTRQLVFIALLAALVFAVDFLLVAGIDAAAGPGVGVMVDTIFVTAITVAGALILPRFGTVTLVVIIYGILITPLALYGPPGIWKLPFVTALGLCVDGVIWIFRYKKLGYYLGFSIINALFVPLLYVVMLWLGLPGTEEMGEAVWLFMAIVFAETMLGVWLGTLLYDKKIKKMHFVKQL